MRFIGNNKLRNKRRYLLCAVYIFIVFMMFVLSACSNESEKSDGIDEAELEQEELELNEESAETQVLNTPKHESSQWEVIDGEIGNYQPYYVRVNRVTNCVTVYQLDEENGQYQAIKPMICSVGREGNTPCGDFSIQERYEWRALFGGVYGQYAVRIVDSILFHSVPYYEESQDTLKTEEFDKLGTSASDGCIRLQVADAKWIYDNCAEETVVTIFDGTMEDDPFPRPEAPILADTDYPEWDPSDPIAANPWNGGDGNLLEEEYTGIWWREEQYMEIWQ